MGKRKGRKKPPPNLKKALNVLPKSFDCPFCLGQGSVEVTMCSCHFYSHENLFLCIGLSPGCGFIVSHFSRPRPANQTLRMVTCSRVDGIWENFSTPLFNRGSELRNTRPFLILFILFSFDNSFDIRMIESAIPVVRDSLVWSVLLATSNIKRRIHQPVHFAPSLLDLYALLTICPPFFSLLSR